MSVDDSSHAPARAGVPGGRRGAVLLALALALAWLALEGISAVTIRVAFAPPESSLPTEDGEWLVNAKSGYRHGFFVADKHVIWLPAPNFVQPPTNNRFWGTRPLVLNSHGHRSPEIPVQKPPGVKRILLLGGSHPFGMWVETDEAAIAVVGATLEARAPGKWQWINAASPGHTTYQGRRYLEEYSAAFAPDIVVFDLGMNDQLPLSIAYAQPDHVVAAVPTGLTRMAEVAEVSFVYRLLRKLLEPSAGRSPEATVRVPDAQRRQNLDAVGALGSERGFKVLYMDQISVDRVGPGGVATCQHRLADEGYEPVVPLCALFEALGPEAGALFHDPIHATAQGHRLIAEAIMAKLDELGWVDPPQAP